MLAVSSSTGLKICGAMGLMFLTTMVYADAHSIKPGERSTEHTVTHGKKWETDEALRLGMENIRQAMAANQEGIERERLSAQEYQQLAEALDKYVADIVKNCNLTKKADAAFHAVVLADLTQSTKLMRTSTKTQAQRVGALGVMQSLRNYGEYFQHPGWRLGAV